MHNVVVVESNAEMVTANFFESMDPTVQDAKHFLLFVIATQSFLENRAENPLNDAPDDVTKHGLEPKCYEHSAGPFAARGAGKFSPSGKSCRA